MVTYLFGAGASAPTIPLATSLKESMIQFQIELQEHIPTIKYEGTTIEVDTQSYDYKKVAERLHEKIKMFNENIKNFSTVDTYAKMLEIKGQKDILQELKLIMTSYFIWQQANQDVHERYDSFFASILSTINDLNSVIPDRIKILTWNYDIQMELSLYKFIGNPNMTHSSIARKAWIVNNLNNNHLINNYSILKINGTAIPIDKRNETNYLSFKELSDSKFRDSRISAAFKSYIRINRDQNPMESGISFAWERDTSEISEAIFNRILKPIQHTKYLVAVGYSFPFFNREVDRKIFGNLPELEKVYVQGADLEDSKNLVNRIESIFVDRDQSYPKITIKAVEDKNQFFLPPEL